MYVTHIYRIYLGENISVHAQVAEADIKKANYVSRWLGYGAQKLGPVRKRDGATEERVLETWVPKKKVKAFSLRCWACSPPVELSSQYWKGGGLSTHASTTVWWCRCTRAPMHYLPAQQKEGRGHSSCCSRPGLIRRCE